MNIRKIYKIIPFLILFLVLIIIASIYDLQISIRIANPESVWGRFFEIAGEPPSLLFSAFNAAIIFVYVSLNKPNKYKTYQVLSGLVMFVTVFYTMQRTIKYILSWSQINYNLDGIAYFFIFLFSICISFVMIYFVKKIKKDTLDSIIRIAVSCVIAALGVLIIISLLKLVWGRMRFREMVAVGDFKDFSKWYIPQGITGHNSFPSGHTANATLIYTISLYFPNHQRWLKPIIIMWIVIIALSRLFVGAHFLSDITIACTITFLIIFTSKFFIIRKK